jgi:hypothetical protein
MQLNDDTLLEEIKFTEAVDDQSDLALLDQCIILASWYVVTVALLAVSVLVLHRCCALYLIGGLALQSKRQEQQSQARPHHGADDAVCAGVRELTHAVNSNIGCAVTHPRPRRPVVHCVNMCACAT